MIRTKNREAEPTSNFIVSSLFSDSYIHCYESRRCLTEALWCRLVVTRYETEIPYGQESLQLLSRTAVLTKY